MLMKTKTINKLLLLTLPLALSVGSFFGSAKKQSEPASAYTSSSLPTTIDLNPVGEDEIRDYYSAAQGKNKEDLLKALKPILMDGQKYYSYDSGDSIWKMYEITDRDWDLSPASEMKSGTYNPTTNIITNYKYRNNEVEDPYVRALYVNRDAANPKTAWASHGERNKANTIEREHIWPKSHGFDSGKVAGARGDPMHLWAADGTANGMHLNLFYGYVDKTKSYKDAGNTHDILWGNLTGTSKTLGSGNVFEPQDSDKGDIARACFYMVARYNNLAGDDDNIDGANPNLSLSNNLSENSRTGTSTPTDDFSLGLVQDLLEWNKLDPVDEYEIKRNDLLYVNYTNNRNPFIDFPEWADIIWGDESGTAQPETDGLNGVGGGSTTTKTVTGIEITTPPTKTTYVEGQTFSTSGMVVTAYYDDLSSAPVTGYTVSKTTALTTSDTEITITYKGFTDTVSITVTEAPKQEWQLVTSNQADWSGTYLLTNATSGEVKVLDPSSLNSSAFVGIDATITEGVISGEGADDSFALTIEKSTTEGKYKISGAGKYFGKNENSNGVDSATTFSTDLDNTITYSDNKVLITGNGGKALTWYPQNSNFKYYAPSNNRTQLLKKAAGGAEVIHPSSVTISDEELTLEEGETQTITASVLPNNVTDDSIDWSSSDENVATVNNGTITAISAGTTVIRAAAHDTNGNCYALCAVTVTPATILSSITLSGSYKTNYIIGQELDTSGLVVTAHYTQAGIEVDTETVTSDCEFEGFDSETSGTKTVTVSYEGKSATFTVNVFDKLSAKVDETGAEGWTLVNSEDDLVSGDVYTIACITKGKVALPMGTNSYFQTDTETTNMTYDEGVMTPNEGVNPVQLVLGGSEGEWTLNDGVGLVSTKAAKALKHNEGTTTWKISFKGNNVEILSTTETYGSIQYNASNPRFCAYSSNQTAISLFKLSSGSSEKTYTISAALTEVILEQQEILDAACANLNVSTSTWTSITLAILPFLDDPTSNDYKALMFGKGKSSLEGGNALEDFLQRYDEIVYKYGYESFIEKGNDKRTKLADKTAKIDCLNNDYLPICIISLSACAAMVCFLAYKKKKND